MNQYAVYRPSIRVLKRGNGVLHAFSGHRVFNERIMGRISLPSCREILRVLRLHFIEEDERNVVCVCWI